MDIARIKGANHCFGGPDVDGFLPLWVRLQRFTLEKEFADGTKQIIPGAPEMLMEFVPTDEERAKIARGENIFLSIVGTRPPPLMIYAGDPNGPDGPRPAGVQTVTIG